MREGERERERGREDTEVDMVRNLLIASERQLNFPLIK